MKQSLSPWIVAAGNHTSVAGWVRPLVLLVCITSAAFAQFPVAGLHTIFPPGAKSGTTIDVTVSGQNLEGKQKLLFSHVGIMAKTKARDPGPL